DVEKLHEGVGAGEGLGQIVLQFLPHLVAHVEGSTATQVRDDIYLVNVIGRARASERDSIQKLENLQLSTSNGKVVPLSAVANFRY
ncbi:hypothetical protein ACC761_39750, partial [Rhizobium ruizarguesonis]